MIQFRIYVLFYENIVDITDICIEEAVDAGHHKALKWREDIGAVRPDAELECGPLQGLWNHCDGVGDAQQREQEQRVADWPSQRPSQNMGETMLLNVKFIIKNHWVSS